jgi:hypothetical protein
MAGASRARARRRRAGIGTAEREPPQFAAGAGGRPADADASAAAGGRAGSPGAGGRQLLALLSQVAAAYLSPSVGRYLRLTFSKRVLDNKIIQRVLKSSKCHLPCTLPQVAETAAEYARDAAADPAHVGALDLPGGFLGDLVQALLVAADPARADGPTISPAALGPAEAPVHERSGPSASGGRPAPAAAGRAHDAGTHDLPDEPGASRGEARAGPAGAPGAAPPARARPRALRLRPRRGGTAAEESATHLAASDRTRTLERAMDHAVQLLLAGSHNLPSLETGGPAGRAPQT